MFPIIDDIIASIPNILQYFVPGYIGVFCFQFAGSKQYSREAKVVASCVLSFILITLCNLVHQLAPNAVILGSMYLQVAAASVAAAVLGIIGAIVVKSQWYCKACLRFFAVSPRTNVLEGALDRPDGTNVYVHFKGGKNYYIYGHLAGYDTKDDDKWLYISEPRRCNLDGSTDRQFDRDDGYLCRLADVDYMYVE